MKKIVVLCLLLSFGFQSCTVYRTPRRSERIVVRTAPRGAKVVVVKNNRYYTWGGHYYRQTQRGFVRVRL